MTSAGQGFSFSSLNLMRALGPEKGSLGSRQTWWCWFLRGGAGGKPQGWQRAEALLVLFSSVSSCGSGTRF